MKDARSDDAGSAPARGSQSLGARRPDQRPPCAWCGRPIVLKATGRTPKWCSATCRHRAWEQSRAAASGRSAVTVVDRPVEVEKLVEVVRTVEVGDPRRPRGAEWTEALAELSRQLDGGLIYNRDLPALFASTNGLVESLNRRGKEAGKAVNPACGTDPGRLGR